VSDKLEAYRRAESPLPGEMSLIPLYGAGFENLGVSGKPIRVPVPRPRADELLVRHDAVGLCFSDYKVIRAGQSHPRIRRDMSKDPVVLGHEVALTVVGVGEDLRGQYRVGDRFLVQADIYVDGVGHTYGYEIQGGLSQFNIVDQRVLNGDGGCYLLPLQPTTGYAEAALTEPWACVEAACNAEYRTTWLRGGSVLVAGEGDATGWESWHPARVCLASVSPALAERVYSWGAARGIEVAPDDGQSVFDDILVLSSDADLIEAAATRLAGGGVLAVLTNEQVARRIQFDVGRLHYDAITLVGASGDDVSAAYVPVRKSLKAGGCMWAMGAAGPMGHMHVQRAIELDRSPALIVATNLRSPRISELADSYGSAAEDRGIKLVCLTEEQVGSDAFRHRLWEETRGRGFDDIVVLAPSTAAFGQAIEFAAPGGLVNLFAGLRRGTMAPVDVNKVVGGAVRLIGTSGSSIADMRRMLALSESGAISTNRSVAAIGSLEAAIEGLVAVSEGRFAGKVVIYPQISHLPLTPLPGLKTALPNSYRRLADGREWTLEAEEELLRTLL